MNTSNLIELQQSSGAVVQGDASDVDEVTVLHFGDPAAEFHAAAESVALFDVSCRTQIQMTGSDRHKFLHNFCTNDIKQLAPGQACEAFVLNVKGRVLGHIFVFCYTESLWIESAAGSNERLMAHLNRYIITEDVQLCDRTFEFAELLLSGPDSTGHLEKTVLASELPNVDCFCVDFAGKQLQIRRVDWLGSPGFLLSLTCDAAPELWRCLTESGIQAAGATAFHPLRIEAGMPIYGRDISEENLAQEVARTKQAISFTKGCYLGQEPVARIDAMGHVNRELRGLRIDAETVPPVGSTVIDGDKEIGAVTSSALSFRDNKAVALAYLRSASAKPGTVVQITTDDEPADATVFSSHSAE